MRYPRTPLFSMTSCILLLSFCTACSGSSSSAPQGAPPAESPSPAVPAQEEQISLTQIGTEGGAELRTSSPNGFYELVPIFPNSYSILYTDYAANQQVYLCSNPGCDHNGDSCTSYVDASADTIPGLLFSDEKLYLISPASVREDFLPHIEVMDANGANRTLLAEFKASQNLNTGWYLADESSLYFVLEDVGSDGNYTKALCSVNKQSGKVQTVLELGYNEWILDGQGTEIFLKRIEEGVPPERDLFETEEAFQEAVMEASRHKVFAFDLNSPDEPRLVDEWSQKERLGSMLGGKMYYYDVSADTFVERDYTTGSTVTVANSAGVSFSSIYPQKWMDGKLVFTAAANRQENHISNFYIDFANHTMGEIGVMDQNRNRPVELCAIYGGRIYAIYSTAENEIFFEMDGKMEQSTIVISQLGSMPVQDFFAGSASFAPCKTIESNRQ